MEETHSIGESINEEDVEVRIKTNPKAKAFRKKNIIFQEHHLTYKPVKTVMLRKGEHWIVTQLSWLKELTPGAKQAIRYLLSTKPKYTGKIPRRKIKNDR